MRLTANCKINLTMEVLSKRPDGYHNIRSVMQFLDIGDRVELTPAGSFSFWCDDAELCGEHNLAVRAYRLMERLHNVAPVALRLYKSVPCMSGMGGGSADAAAVLRGLNELNGLNLPPEHLAALSAELGADLPACVIGGALLAEGVGERLTPIAQDQPLWFNIIKPEVSFSTPAMYAKLDKGGFAEEREQSRLIEAMQRGDAQGIAPWLCNSFEAVADPGEAIGSAKELLLSSGALAASMTGAGSAVFGIFKGEQEARGAFERIRGAGAQSYLCHSAGSHYTVTG